jgi:lipopolysaccharide transport system permease protein
MGSDVKELATTIIQPSSGWQLVDFKELKEYRDLFYFLVWRDIKVLYAQTIMGFSWAILQPLIQIIMFTIIFGSVAKLPTDGIPYLLFSTVAIIPWTYMSTAMSTSSQSLVASQGMLGKIYFPRVIYPLTPVLSKLVDFGISLLIVLVVLVYYQVPPTMNLLFLPVFVLTMIIVPAGIGMWLSALAIRFRDVKFAMQFFIRMLMYTAPVVYSASSVPENYRFLYSLNPLVSVVEGFRSCLLGMPMQWAFLFPGIAVAIFIFVSGALYFKHMERIFVDVI